MDDITIMKATELRIGNLVYAYGVPSAIEVIQLHKDKIVIDATGIPLTEEWLKKFGCRKLGKFKRNVIDFETIYLIADSGGVMSCVCLYEKPNEAEWYFKYGFSDLYPKGKLQYIHQLQNLYFALTGEELEINEQ